MDIKVYRIKTEHMSEVCSTSCHNTGINMSGIAMNLYEEIKYFKDIDLSCFNSPKGPLSKLSECDEIQELDVVSIENSPLKGTFFYGYFGVYKLKEFDIGSDKTIKDVLDGRL